MTSIPQWVATHAHWIGFHAALLVLLAIELLYSRRAPRPLSPEDIAARNHKDSVAATVMWIAAALAFAAYVLCRFGTPSATQFLAGYALEESLSIDNLFVFLLLFRVFKVAPAHQPKVLFWGVAGAILMRGLFIGAGLSLLARFHWVSYVFAVILLVAAVRLVMPEDTTETSDKPPAWTVWITRIHPVSLRQDRFFTVEDGRRMVTMLFLALLAIEFTDVVFALDSIPAVLSITRDPFLAYTSNILAVMGLRSLFFLLAQMLKKLRLLHYGLAAILAFAAVKMLTATIFEVGPLLSLGVIAVVLAITIGLSLLFPGEDAAAS
ncbi:TerC/Alx family metal homeostasis membrane protein [Granulicella sp. WH15]|uniref:TerC/Alx family metal homeostasis membrane protein n=1 Tax=Granulicella sp. WH15 TaxID=2602070 RepID=UPI001366CF5E|nr:TerC/Alx family metal homeostasis membrane protein [Granulicella sp. WH15]QHN04566.1 TerC/Alx family metal homeostasis membrane protein [Granulicella sp. WH15]